jgi:hypothetical protein
LHGVPISRWHMDCTDSRGAFVPSSPSDRRSDLFEANNEKGGLARQGSARNPLLRFSVMHLRYILAGIYIAFGLLQYSSIGGVGAQLQEAKEPPLWRKVLVILLWPLAMIGAIEG